MKIRTWEKWYWGIVSILTAFIVVGICRSKQVTVTIGNKQTVYTDLAGKLKVGLVIAGILLVIFLVIWLIMRLFAGSRERERER